MSKLGLLRAAPQSRQTSLYVRLCRRTAASPCSSANRRDGSRRKPKTRHLISRWMLHRSNHFSRPQPQLLGISRYTLKTDVVNMLEGCNLSLEDVKVDYNRAFTRMGMVVQFRSWTAFENAASVISRKGRLYKLERANRSQWDNLTPHDGKTNGLSSKTGLMNIWLSRMNLMNSNSSARQYMP